MHEAIYADTPPHELISIGGGEAMAPYMHNKPNYIPNVLSLAFQYKFIPTLKTNGTWGDDDNLRTKILSDIADCAYRSGKLVTLDISVDEFHNNLSGITNIIYDTICSQHLCPAIRICLVGFNTKKSAFIQTKLQQKLQKRGLKITPTIIGDWIVETKNGDGVYMINDFSGGIFNLGRAKTNKVYTTTDTPNGYENIDCIQLDNNDTATLNYIYREKIKNRNIDAVLKSLQQRARGY